MIKNTDHKSKILYQASSKLTWLPKKTFELEFSIPWAQIKISYDQVLKEAVLQTEIKGFRKGKAPIALVEKSIDKQKLYEEIIKRLLPSTYDQVVKKHNLRPIISPKITLVSAQENSNWLFKAASCEKPDIKLGSYEQAIKGEFAKIKIWTPEKGKPNTKTTPDLTQDQKINISTKILLDTTTAEIADVLVEDELNRMLTRFIDQINSLGMTVNQYLSSKRITIEQLRNDYRKQAETTLKMEFILEAIVEVRKIQVSKDEIDKMINVNKDEKIRTQLNTPLQRAYITSILAKRKVLDYLTNL